MNMTEVEKALQAYKEKFGDTFPTYVVNPDEWLPLINEALATGKPYEFGYDADSDY